MPLAEQTGLTLEWWQFVLAAIGTVLLPILLVTLQRRWERSDRLADWFAERYIEQGIDPLHEHFSQCFSLSSRPAMNAQMKMIERVMEEPPFQAVARLGTIVGVTAFNNWFNSLRTLGVKARNLNDFNRATQFTLQCGEMAGALDRLRMGLVVIRLRRKGDAYRQRSIASVQEFTERLIAWKEGNVQDPLTRTYTAKPSASGPGVGKPRTRRRIAWHKRRDRWQHVSARTPPRRQSSSGTCTSA